MTDLPPTPPGNSNRSLAELIQDKTYLRFALIVSLLVFSSGWLSYNFRQPQQQAETYLQEVGDQSQPSCQTGLRSFQTESGCAQDAYRWATFSCYDGFSEKLGSGQDCKNSGDWLGEAKLACQGRSSCQ